ncbi:MAG: transcriptional regulator [Rhodobacteraceae bacterium HLUCCA12]|nr:MAG: transcriptional regulator [Rhodobacteraceae bacterium HLUCCA12]
MDFDIRETDENDSKLLPLGSSFGNLVRHVNRLIQRDLGERIAPLGITLGQWYALRTLWVSDGITQIEVAQRSGIAGAAMVSAIRSLISMGLVSRKVDPKDRRKYVISLTERGRSLEKPALQAAIDANVAAMNGISKSDRDLCLSVLRRAHQNLISKENEEPARDERLDL